MGENLAVVVALGAEIGVVISIARDFKKVSPALYQGLLGVALLCR